MLCHVSIDVDDLDTLISVDICSKDNLPRVRWGNISTWNLKPQYTGHFYFERGRKLCALDCIATRNSPALLEL